MHKLLNSAQYPEIIPANLPEIIYSRKCSSFKCRIASPFFEEKDFSDEGNPDTISAMPKYGYKKRR
jgi:hypothetical protein